MLTTSQPWSYQIRIVALKMMILYGLFPNRPVFMPFFVIFQVLLVTLSQHMLISDIKKSAQTVVLLFLLHIPYSLFGSPQKYQNDGMFSSSQAFYSKNPRIFFSLRLLHYCYSFALQYLLFHEIICHDGYMMFHVHFFSTFIKVAQILGPFDDSLFYK